MLTWLIPALVGSMASNGILTILHLLIWSQYRQRFLLYWTAAWGSYILVLGLVYLGVTTGPSIWFMGMQYTLALVSACFLLAGTKSFINEEFGIFWKIVLLAGLLWIPGSFLMGLPPSYCATGIFLLIGAIQICCGYKILRSKRDLGFPCLWAGWSLILWGLHRADYPFLKDVAWFAPWGFLIAAILTITVSMTLLLMFLEQIRSDLEDTRKALETILGVVPVGIAMGKGEKMVWNNPFLDHLLGYEAGHLTGKYIRDQFHSKEEYDHVSKLFREDMEGSRLATAEISLRHKNGSTIPIAISGRLINQNHAQQGHIVALIDLTQQKRSENTLRELAAGVAHNFNNLLMAISSNAQAAKSLATEHGASSEKMGELLDNVIKASLSGRDISRRLAASVAARTRYQHNGEEMDLSEPLNTALDLSLSANSESGSGIIVENKVPPGISVKGVAGELVEVFQNLIGNAMDSMQGRGKLTIWVESNPGSAVIYFRDSGKGMDEATLAQAFDPFFSTKGAKGQGLGLTASRGIIRAHGGELRITSQPDLGATAIISLPLSAEADQTAASKSAPDIHEQASILLVEDEVLVALGLSAVLEAAGHRVTHVARLHEAQHALQNEDFGLVLSDLSLPDGTGWDLARTLGSMKEDAPPLIILTGRAQAHSGSLPDDAVSPVAILDKPVDSEVLLAKISQVIAH